jgi:N6-L-threonylcarbamoyladenine synthase
MTYCLAIETSCDETSLALLAYDRSILDDPSISFYDRVNSIQKLVSLVSSQIDIHKLYGGVVPEIGAREHSKLIYPLFLELISLLPDADLQSVCQKIDTIAVTTTPGLDSALRVGQEFAKSLAFNIANQPNITSPKIIPVNHLQGHVISSFYQKPFGQFSSITKDQEIFPHLQVLVSGGNTQFIEFLAPGQSTIIGATLDDACGESFDKIGRMLGLPYPGGVWISKIAKFNQANLVNLPKSMQGNPSFNVSYSGLKTAVRYLVQSQGFTDWKFEQPLTQSEVDTLLAIESIDQITNLPEHLQFIYKTCVSAEMVIFEQIFTTIRKIFKQYNFKSIGMSGGVSASPYLRRKMTELDLPLFIPDRSLTGDNAVMIGLSGLIDHQG